MSTRRTFLRGSGGAFVIGLTACGGGSSGGTRGNPENSGEQPAYQEPESATPDLPAGSNELHLLKRTTWGATPSELARVSELGSEAWLEEQLALTAIDDPSVEAEVGFRWPTVNYSACQLAQLKDDGRVMRDLRAATLFRRVFSRRQLHEVMVDFWSDHFTIYHGDGIARYMKTIDDRELIRANALGSFRSLLHGSAKSPAMLEFLDNRRSSKQRPNENYARELMELHTLGVDGGYTETDIANVARAFTGWTVEPLDDSLLCLFNTSDGFLFNADNHDTDEKQVLGYTLAAGRGIEDGEDVLDILVDHPSTRRFIAEKLYRRFVADTEAPSAFLSRLASAWGADGDIPALLRALFSSSEFAASKDAKLSRPQEYGIALVRAIEPEMDSDITLMDLLRASAIPDLYTASGLANIEVLPGLDFSILDPLEIDPTESYEGPNSEAMISRCGHVPFQWPSPDGYPDSEAYWASANGLLERWRYAIQVASQARSEGGESNAYWAAGGADEPAKALENMRSVLLMRPLDDGFKSRVLSAAQVRADGGAANAEQCRRRLMAMLLISPYMQRR